VYSSKGVAGNRRRGRSHSCTSPVVGKLRVTFLSKAKERSLRPNFLELNLVSYLMKNREKILNENNNIWYGTVRSKVANHQIAMLFPNDF
jgi:hypothetical protein